MYVTINHNWVINQISWAIRNSYTLRHRHHGTIDQWSVLIIWFLRSVIFHQNWTFHITTTTQQQHHRKPVPCCDLVTMDNFTARPVSDWSAAHHTSLSLVKTWARDKRQSVPRDQPTVTRANYCLCANQGKLVYGFMIIIIWAPAKNRAYPSHLSFLPSYESMETKLDNFIHYQGLFTISLL